MADLNIRLYGNQVYGLSSSFLNEYISPSIEKEDFLSMFKNGFIKYENINTKKEIIIHPTLSINNILLNSLEINVPNEKDHFIINIDGIKSEIILSEINEDDLKELMISQRKALKEKFIKDLFYKITKKSDSSSFLKGLLENIIKKIIEGLTINLKNIVLLLKFKNLEFLMKINDLNLKIENKELKIDFNNFSLSYKNDNDNIEIEEENIINNFNININFIIKANENNENNENFENNGALSQLKINTNKLEIKLNSKVIQSIFEIVNIFRDIKYYQKYCRYKKLIEFHKPKTIDNKKNYRLLWLYAIKTVIKLRKFTCFDNFDIFELINSAQKKILEKERESENFIIPNDINLLYSTKNEIEKKIINSKESFANKFFSFFSSKTEEKSLTEKEKEMIEDAFKENNLEKYLIKGKFDEDNCNENEIIKKIRKYLFNFEIYLNLEKMNIYFNNKRAEDNNNNISIKDKKIYLNKVYFFVKYNNNYTFNIRIKDIGGNENETFCREIVNEKNNDIHEFIEILYENKHLNFKLRKKVEIPEITLYLIICYINFLIQNIIDYDKRNIFYKEKKENIKSNLHESLKINIPFIPSLTLITKDNNKIELEIKEISQKNECISFQIRLKDLYNIFLEDCKINILRDEQNGKYTVNLENPLNININKKIISDLLNNYKIINNSIISQREYNNNKLFNFKFIKYINNLNNISLFNNNINIIINNLCLLIKDENNDSSIKLNHFNFLYEFNNNFSILANEIFFSFDLISILPIIKDIQTINIYNHLNSFLYKYNFYNIIQEIIKSIKIDINNFKGILYITHKSYYMDFIANGINGNNVSNNSQIINLSLNDLNINWFFAPDTIKIVDSKNIIFNFGINSFSEFIFKLKIESILISSIFMIYNFQTLQEILKYFFKLKVIYEIIIKDFRSEIFESYLKNGEDKNKSNLDIYLTNYKNEKIDEINLEKYGLAYHLELYTNLFIKIDGKYLKFFGSQRDLSFLFFSVLKPDDSDEPDEKDESFSYLINSIIFDVNLYEIKLDFHEKKSYDIIFFDFHLGKLFLNINMIKANVKNFYIGLNKIQMNYYKNNLKNNKIVPITLLNYQIDNAKNNKNIETIKSEEKNQIKYQIEIKKDLNNKLIISINKINILFIYDILLSLFNFFHDISIFDLIKNKIKEIKAKNKLNKIKAKEEDTQIDFILSEVLFQFKIDYFNSNNYIYFYLNQFDLTYIKIVNYLVKDYRIKISLNNIKLYNNKRDIIFSKDEYLLFALNIKESKDNNFSVICNSLFNNLNMNLSYKDIILLYKIFLDIQNLYTNISRVNKNINISKKKGKTNFIYHKSSNINENIIKSDGNFKGDSNNNFMNFFNSIICEINIESINITLLENNIIILDNINNSYYYPFLNFNLNKTKINYESNRNNKNFPYKKYNISYNIIVNYYNDEINIWEPLTEDLIIILDYLYKKENKKFEDNYTFTINKLIVNLSDIFINILLIKMNNWIEQFYEHFNYLKRNNRKKLSNHKEIGNIILKYIFYNYTDLNLIINYDNKNFILNNSKELCINFDENEFGINNNLNNFIMIEYEKNNIIILYPPEIGIKQYKINIDNIEKIIYIETKKSKKHIDIFIVNSIIIKNNTNYFLDIYLNENNENKKETKIINLNPGSTKGLLNNFSLNENSTLHIEFNKDKNLEIYDKNLLSNSINLKEIISKELNQKIYKDISFKDNNLFLSLIAKNKFENYRKLTISYKYCILNCLPCSLFINKSTQSENDIGVEIKKNSIYNIDDISLIIDNKSIKLKIKIKNNYFYSILNITRKETKKLIKFKNINNNESIILSILIKQKLATKAIIIYSEYMFYNQSGIELNLTSQDDNKRNLLYNIENNITLVSSEFFQSDPVICIKSNKSTFLTNYIQYNQIKDKQKFEFSLYLENKLDGKNYNFDLIINKITSNLWCDNDKNNFFDKIKEDFDLINIYKIIPKYNIINNAITKNIKENNINLLLKQNMQYYLLINIKNYEDILDNKHYYMFDNLSINSLYTVCIGENLYNVEVKKTKSGGYKDIFIFNNILKYSQVIVENKTNYDIILKQKKYEKFKQEIKKNEIQILKIYEQASQDFSAQIDNKLYYLNLNEIGKKLIKHNLYLNIEQNRKSKKISFFIENKNDDNDDYIQKSKSVMTLPKIVYNKLKINFIQEQDRHIKINLILNHINISIIAQNKNSISNKDTYDRKEIALLFIDDFQCGIKLLKSKYHILQNKKIYNIQLNLKISHCEIYNLLMNNNFSCLFINQSSPLINIYSEINYDFDKNRIIINELVNEIGGIKLNIVPIFLKESYNFIKNIILKLKYHYNNINHIFLDQYKSNYNNTTHNNLQNLTIIIEKIDILGIKIRFKLNREGLDSLPKLIIDFIEYLKCFPFFSIDKETKAILGRITLDGPFKDIKTCLNKLKLMVITQLSKEIVIKALHPSTNEIKENINNMIGYDNKIITINSTETNILRVKNKRVFIGKNKMFKKYNINQEIFMHKIKEDLQLYKDNYIIDIIHQKNYILILLEDHLFYVNDSNVKKYIHYKYIKDIKCEKNIISIKFNDSKENDFILEFSDEFLIKKINYFLTLVSHH